MEKINHTRSSNLLSEEQFEDDKLEEKKTRAYSKVVGYIKRKKKVRLKIKEGKIYPLAFYKDGDLIGYTEIKDGKLFFGGNLDESARQLFEKVKKFTMEYISKQST